MFFVVLGIIITIGLFIGLGFIEYEGQVSPRVFAFLALIICLLGNIKTVPTGNTGIVTTFGRVENVTLDAGIHFMAPWKKVIKMDNRTQKQSIEMACFSSDIQEVNVTYTVNYQINKANAQEIYRTIGTDYFDKIVMPKALEAVKSVFAKYTAEDLIASRSSLSKEIETILIEKLEAQNIQITATSIENIDFTDSYEAAIEAKQVATQEKQRAKTLQEQQTMEAQQAAERNRINADAEATVKKLNADAEAYAIKVRAEAEAEANLKISKSLTQELINYTQALRWDGKLPTVSGGSTPITNVTDFMDK